MESFAGKIAVVTGGGSGMGRELVVQLAGDGCHVATCDVREDGLAETAERARTAGGAAVRVTTHLCDVGSEDEVVRFRDEVASAHSTDHINLLFNNAGVGGGGSFVTGSREEWERTFAICWSGVYYCSRAFVPMLVASDGAYLVNTSSVNGFMAKLGETPHTAYSTAKFAVKGFSEALITDFAAHAPHVKVAVVMPGHIGTDIVANSGRIHSAAGSLPKEASEMMERASAGFRDNAPVSAAQAATVILDGVRAGKWRILIGEDAARLDEMMRENPETFYGRNGIAETAST